MLHIKRHEASHIVELSDGSTWRIWPADIALTLSWLPDTELEISCTERALWSHCLINREDGSQVRVIDARCAWPERSVQFPESRF